METLKVKVRDEHGTHKAQKLRKAGLVPGVLYGHGEKTVSISMDGHEISLAISRGERLLELDMDGGKSNVLIKHIQYDPFGQDILHVDFTRVDLDELVEVQVPVTLRGTPVGATEGGVLHQNFAQITIRCKVRDIPDDIRVSVAEMKVNDRIYMRDVKLPEGMTMIEDADSILCALNVVAEEVVEAAAPGAEGAEAAAASAEPEVIGEKKREEAAAAAEADKAAEKADKKAEKKAEKE